MEERTNIEMIKEFAAATNRSVEYKEIPYPVSGIRKFQRFKRMVYVPNNSNKTSFFVWYSDPYTAIGIPTVFCGAFIKIPSRVSSSLKIRSKNIIDKINIFSNARKNTIGNVSFDSKALITGNINTGMKRLLTNSRIQYQILDSFNIALNINISINEYNIDFVPELKNNSYLSIINPQSWYLERHEIEPLFSQIEKIRRILNE